MVRAVLAAAALLCAGLAPPAGAQAACRQALALALDVSGSVDSAEYALQRRGLANALRHPQVAEAILALPAAPVRLLVYEWSDVGTGRLIQGWIEITDRATLEALAARLESTPRAVMPPATALGSAMRTGLAHLSAQSACWGRTLDISGDGKSNAGPHPRDQRPAARAAGVTINALVIGADPREATDIRQVEIGELVAYFRAYVISGPDAFVESALGFAEYEAAMVRKLKRELDTMILSRLGPLPQ